MQENENKTIQKMAMMGKGDGPEGTVRKAPYSLEKEEGKARGKKDKKG